MDIPAIEHILLHRFTSSSAVVSQALTHRSFSSDNYERLEFLGDSIVNFVIAEFLWQRFPDATEGQLSRLRAQLVKGETLAAIATELQLGQHIRFGLGEIKSGGDKRHSILADVFEALVAAVYLDAGLDITKERIFAWFGKRLADVSINEKIKDAKSRLQERLQAKQLPLPQYDIVHIDGAEHEQFFTVSCTLPELAIATQGKGRSRKIAEQQAAELALNTWDEASKYESR